MSVPIPRQRTAVLPHEAASAGSTRDDAAGTAEAAGTAAEPADTGGPGLTLLLIGEDPTSSVPEMRDRDGRRARVRTARNLTEAERLLTDDVHCILLDLAPAGAGDGLAPEADGGPDELGALRAVLRMAPAHAVLVLTAEADAERGAEAVRVGAQDYLFRDELDASVLSRAVRYAVERKRADLAQRQLTESRMLAQENRRLERGLLPTPLLDGSDLRFAARYRPGRSRALLGGDFYDTVRTPDGTVHAMIGDVSGHGPDEAALGVELRIAWRALTFAGLCGDALLSTLQKVLENERADDEIFATLCLVDIAPDGRHAGVCLAGHPAPLLARSGGAPRLLPYEEGGPALGLLPGARWPRRQFVLGGSWSLMMYTDGLIEGRIGEGRERLGQEGMAELVGRQLAAGLRGEELLDAAVTEVRDLNGGELTDDVAVLLLDRGRVGG
ncbi:PP2C family protein-serine/threonine phosphatase [Streptomyces rimosus]